MIGHNDPNEPRRSRFAKPPGAAGFPWPDPPASMPYVLGRGRWTYAIGPGSVASGDRELSGLCTIPSRCGLQLWMTVCRGKLGRSPRHPVLRHGRCGGLCAVGFVRRHGTGAVPGRPSSAVKSSSRRQRYRAVGAAGPASPTAGSRRAARCGNTAQRDDTVRARSRRSPVGPAQPMHVERGRAITQRRSFRPRGPAAPRVGGPPETQPGRWSRPHRGPG